MLFPASFPSPATSRALIVLCGDLPDSETFASLRSLHDAVIAADGAANRLREFGSSPDVIVGDLDSVGGSISSFVDQGSLVIEEPDQERNDFEKCLLWAMEQRHDAVTILGMFGGMPDHAANNLSVVARYAARIVITAIDRLCIAYGVVGELLLSVRRGDRISLIPLPRAQVSTGGLEWELSNEILEIGGREGASNRATREEVHIAVSAGVLLVFHYSSMTTTPGEHLSDNSARGVV